MRKLTQKTAAQSMNVLIWLMYIGFGMHIMARSIILPSIKAEFGITYTQTSVIVCASMLGYMAMTGLSSVVSRKIGTKNALTVYIGGLALLSVLISLSDSPAQLTVLFLCSGGCYGGLDCGLVSMVTFCNPDTHARALTRALAFYSLGSVISAVLSGWIVERGINWRMPFLMIGVYCAAVVLLSLRLTFRDPQTEEKKYASQLSQLLRNPLFLYFCVLTAVYAGTENVTNNWLTSFLTAAEPDIGLFYSACVTALYYMANAMGRPLFAHLMKRFNNLKIAIVASLAAASVIFMASFIQSVAPMVVCIVLFGILIAGIYPVLLTTAGRAGGEENVFSVTFVAISLSNMGLNYLVGVVADVAGMAGSFRMNAMLLAGVAGGTLIGMQLLNRKKR